MNMLERLCQSYENHISVPWQEVAPDQRVIFCIYPPKEEQRLRFRIRDFELATKRSNHEWALFDLTDSFADWFSEIEYREQYFSSPELLGSILEPWFLDKVEQNFIAFCDEHDVTNNTVICVFGVSSIFGFIFANELVQRLAQIVNGKLLVFFPGTFTEQDNNYRLLDAYDGWNYRAVAIQAI